MFRAAAFSILTFALAAGTVASASAQTLKLHALRLPATDVVGTWVSFHGRTQSGRSPVREFDQRIAIVSREDLGRGRSGLWVELKTKDSRGSTRIERGLFAPASLRGTDLLPGGDGSQIGSGTGAGEFPETPNDEPGDENELILVRYQAMSGAKLYEYPVGTARHARLGGEVSTFELFEYDPAVKPIRTSVGADTLRLGNRVVPATVERVRRYGTDRWPSNDDSAGIERLVLTQTLWRNGVVPVTGFARSIFQAEMRRLPWDSRRDSLLSGAAFPTRPDSAMLAAAMTVSAQADSLLRADTDAALLRPGSEGAFTPTASRSLLAWTELTLTDLGSNAKPEVTQLPEVPPDVDAGTDPAGYQR